MSALRQTCAAAAVLLVCAVLVSCSERKKVESPSAPPPLTLKALLNAEYASQWPASGRAKLVNGEYREPAGPGSVTEIVVRATGVHAFGDLDGDSIADAALVLESDPGGSGVFYDLVAVLNRAGKPLTLAPVPLGDRIQVGSLTIRNRRIEVHLLRQGPDDPQCCPSVPVVATYRLQGDHLVREDQDASFSSAEPLTR